MNTENNTDKQKLAQIIKDNPNATLIIDNDNWHLNRPIPFGFDSLSESKKDNWFDGECELCSNRDFPSLGCSYGYGVLEAMCWMLGIDIEGV